MKRYCASCGSPTEYTVKKPLFCSSCAKPFDKIEESPTKPAAQKVLMQKKTISNKKYTEDIDSHIDIDFDREEDDISVPNISKLEVDAENETPKSKGVKIGSIIGTSSSPSKRNKQTKNSKTSKKQTLEDFAREAGALRRSKK
jgi:hypothetical protein